MHFGQKMVQDCPALSTMSESEGRKWSKPIMEKRRRERINKSLEELKRLVLEAQHRDSSRYTKLEKADILEMAVKHLRSLRNSQKTVTSGQLLSQTLLPSLQVGCFRCVPEIDYKVTPNTVVMETNQKQLVSRHPSLVPEHNRNVMTVKYETKSLPSDPGSLGLASPRACHPAHLNTAVQFIPMCSSEYVNVCPLGPESSRAFWRPF